MVVMVKGKMGAVETIKSSLDHSAEYCNMKQVLLIHQINCMNKSMV
jgi:hypothetical protein